ncbi:hypothetical protein SDC9_171591 [bioreactor metagenome]|uniref:Uncharacterized protein n=1 Tax=bioreactor metagenome TaxID=1076179 RepID=A0A645GBB0_9ZZZZ
MVDLRHIHPFHTGVTGKLPHNAAVAGSDDQDFLNIGIHRHGYMGDHFVVNKFVFFRHHQKAVQYQDPAELAGLENIDPLKFALDACQLLIDFDGEPHVSCVLLRIP